MALAASDPQWDVIKAEYIVGKNSCQELCKKYDIPYRTMQDRCSREGWTKSRKEYRRRLVENLVENQAKEDAKHLGSLRSAATSMTAVLEQIVERVDFIDEQGGTVKADLKAIKDVVTSLKDLTATIRDLYGLPTQEEFQRMRIAEERLELERLRVDGGDDLTTVRVLMQSAEDYSG